MDKRIEKSNQSILALSVLLRDICKNPASYTTQENIIIALKSQHNLARLSLPTNNISPSSINTLKRAAEKIIEGGFDALDLLRKNALTSIDTKAHEKNLPDRETKAGLSLKIKKLEVEKQLLREDLLLITLALEKSLRLGFRYAQLADSNTLDKCKKEQREILDMLSLRKHSLTSNVVSIYE